MKDAANVIIFAIFAVLAIHAYIQNRLSSPVFFRSSATEQFGDNLKHELLSYVYENGTFGDSEHADLPYQQDTDLSSQFEIAEQPLATSTKPIKNPDSRESLLNGGSVSGFNLDGLTGLDPYHAAHAMYRY